MLDRKFRLTKDEPSGNYEWLHNMTLINDGIVYLHIDADGDKSLVDYCKEECKKKCELELEGTAEDFAYNMDCDCPVSLVYHMAVGHAELRERLKQYEDTGLTPKDILKMTGKDDDLNAE